MDTPRPARAEEVDDLHTLGSLCFGFEPRPPRPKGAPRPKAPRGARVIALDGKPVSVIYMTYNRLSVQGAKIKVVSFGGVGTHPEYRGRGLATRLLSACIEEAVAAKATLLIISGGRGLYRRAHAVPSGPVWETAVRPGDLPSTSDHVVVRRATADDWGAIARLYEAEPVRFLRPAVAYQHASGYSHRSLWIFESQGGPVAYAALGRIWDRAPRSARALGEYAGSRAALLDGVEALLAAAELSELRISIPQHDGELTYLCQGRGLVLKPDTIPVHTIRLLNLPELMRSLRPYALARLTPAEWRALSFAQGVESCRFGYGDESREVGLSQAGALVLGGPGAAKLGGDLGTVLARLCPIPLPLPGLNYA